MAMAMRALRLVVDTGGEGRRRGRPAVAPSVPVLRYATKLNRPPSLDQ